MSVLLFEGLRDVAQLSDIKLDEHLIADHNVFNAHCSQVSLDETVLFQAHDGSSSLILTATEAPSVVIVLDVKQIVLELLTVADGNHPCAHHAQLWDDTNRQCRPGC